MCLNVMKIVSHGKTDFIFLMQNKTVYDMNVFYPSKYMKHTNEATINLTSRYTDKHKTHAC